MKRGHNTRLGALLFFASAAGTVCILAWITWGVLSWI